MPDVENPKGQNAALPEQPDKRIAPARGCRPCTSSSMHTRTHIIQFSRGGHYKARKEARVGVRWPSQSITPTCWEVFPGYFGTFLSFLAWNSHGGFVWSRHTRAIISLVHVDESFMPIPRRVQFFQITFVGVIRAANGRDPKKLKCELPSPKVPIQS